MATTGTYDCVIVGARCAGATAARFLARDGARVLVVDSAKMPSDQPMSTHFIQPFGMRILDELGLGDRVRAIAPPVTTLVNGLDEHVVWVHADYGPCCPRRTDLDALLVDGAREAGAEVRLGTRVVDVVRDGARVTGVVLETDAGRTEVRADVVVGADGRHSTIAQKVGAAEYFDYEAPRAFYWAYFPRPASYAEDRRFQGAAFILHEGPHFRLVFPVNKDQLLLGRALTPDEIPRWREDPTARLLEDMRGHARFAALAEAAPLGKTMGLVKARYFFRQGAGPGWALVGDAGLFKDPTPGLGIADALRDARSVAQAIRRGPTDASLERYWRERDVQSLELFHFAKELGDPGYNNPFNRILFEKLAKDPHLAPRLVDVIERRLSPFQMFKVGEVLRWTLGKLVRGKFGVLKPFFAAGKVQSQVGKELAARMKLVAALGALPGPAKQLEPARAA